jgi:hypothetical protein
MRNSFHPAHLGLVAVALVFVSSMAILGGRAYQRGQQAPSREERVASRPPVDGHRVSLASASGK